MRAAVAVALAGCGHAAAAARTVDNAAPAGPIVVLVENEGRANVVGCGTPGELVADEDHGRCAALLGDRRDAAGARGPVTLGDPVPAARLEGDWDRAFALPRRDGQRERTQAWRDYELLVWPASAAPRLRRAAPVVAGLDPAPFAAAVRDRWSAADAEGLPEVADVVPVTRLDADLDGDGEAEEIVTVTIWRGAGAVLWRHAGAAAWQVAEASDWSTVAAIAAVDLDLDGRDEVVIATSYNEGEGVGIERLAAPAPDPEAEPGDPVPGPSFVGVSGWGYGD